MLASGDCDGKQALSDREASVHWEAEQSLQVAEGSNSLLDASLLQKDITASRSSPHQPAVGTATASRSLPWHFQQHLAGHRLLPGFVPK